MNIRIGTRVRHNGHGDGTVIGFNTQNGITYDHVDQLIPEIVQAGLGQALVNSFYSADRYPYVIRYDSGFQEVYSPLEFEVIS